MPRATTVSPADLPAPLRALLADSGDGAPAIEDKVRLLHSFRASAAEADAALDRYMLGEIGRLRSGLTQTLQRQEELKGILASLGAPPWYPAVYIGPASARDASAAFVVHGGARRVVMLGPDLEASELAVGDEVLLGSDLNVILARANGGACRCGEIATFDRYAADRRLILTSRDEEFVVDQAACLRDRNLQAGDLVRWDRSAWLAFETIERTTGQDLFLEEVPRETFDDIGGLDSQIEEVLRAVLLHVDRRDLVARYALKPKRSILLWGPPGNGKTLIARALANRLQSRSRSGRAKFMNIRPAELHSMWYAESERRYREVFRIAREASERDGEPVLIFFDEVDAIGMSRGGALGHVDDRVLAALLTELEGLESRGNVLVVGATNRRDMLDPALVRPGRLGDCVVHVPPPGRKAARAILFKHLPVAIPYAANGHGTDAAAVRDDIIETVVSRLYAPNGDADLASIMFRDGKRRTLRASDLVSGAVLAKIALAAVERACIRDAETGEPGVRLDDALCAMTDEFASTARAMTPANCRAYVPDLPQDAEVVGVQPIERQVRRPGRYLVNG